MRDYQPLLAHMVGDFVIQSDWMATEKTSRALPAAVHAATYTVCFLPITRNPRALAVIGGTHYLIDRYRLAKYVAWAKNQAVPRRYRYPFSHGPVTGYHDGPHFNRWTSPGGSTHSAPSRVDSETGCEAPCKPEWMSVWLMIALDNACHLIINRAALEAFNV